MPAVLILVHPKENRRKCTLEPLRGREGLTFRTWRPGMIVDASGYTLLEPGGPELTAADRGRPLLLLDATWRYVPRVRGALRGSFQPRSLPQCLRTAYPRRTLLGEAPPGGLASVEALYAALRILGERDDTLLADYPWRDAFLAACAAAGLP